jgi:hypothetical protein
MIYKYTFSQVFTPWIATFSAIFSEIFLANDGGICSQRRLHLPIMHARAATSARPRDQARYIAVRARDQTFYFEIDKTGSLICPAEFGRDATPEGDAPRKRGCGFEFVGFLDAAKLAQRTVGYSIADLLARPFVPMLPPILA